jgi:hypothetical protein
MKLLYYIIPAIISISFYSCKDNNNPLAPSPGEKPEVALISPTSSTEILDSVYVEISAKDNKGITRVDFIIDNVIIKSWNVGPYKTNLDLSMFSDSSWHTAYAKAYDADSNYTTTPVLTLSFRRLFAPSNFWAESFSEKVIKLHWKDMSRFETGYQVEMSDTNDVYKIIGSTAANDTSFVVNNLDKTNSYNFRVRPLKNNYEGAYATIAGLTYQSWWESGKLFALNGNTPRSMVFSKINGLIYTGTTAGAIQVNNYVDGNLKKTIQAHSSSVLGLALSPDGNYLSSSSSDYTIKIWNLSNYSLVKTITTSNYYCSSIFYSPDGTMIAGSQSYDVKIWNSSTGAQIRSISLNNSNYSAICFSQDGSTLIYGDGSSIKFCRISDGSIYNTISLTSTVYSLTVSHDGQTLAAGSYDGFIRLYDAQSGFPINTLAGVSNSITQLFFSEDDKLLLTSDSYSSINLWNLDSSTNVMNISQYSNNTYCLAFGIDNNSVLCSGYSGYNYTINIIRETNGWKGYTGYKK